MSMHKSLKSKDELVRRRNVLTRAERIQRLKEEERWDDKKSAFGLPKVKPRVVAAPTRARHKVEKEAETEAGEGAEEGSAPE